MVARETELLLVKNVLFDKISGLLYYYHSTPGSKKGSDVVCKDRLLDIP